ncbi:MAG: hypothetical protein IKH05_00470 [Bacteroidaceae bacterium]|nr:hypothetical protein [Bacteroidaceae bacterium]
MHLSLVYNESASTESAGATVSGTATSSSVATVSIHSESSSATSASVGLPPQDIRMKK